MAKIESSYININRLNPGGRPARGLRTFDGSKVNKHRRAYVNDGVRNVIVYDELRTKFITPDEVEISAKGGSLVKPNTENKESLYYIISSGGINGGTEIYSKATDFEGVESDLDYSLYMGDDLNNGNTEHYIIEPNESKDTRTYKVFAQQEKSNLTSEIIVTQNAEKIEVIYEDPIVDYKKGQYGIKLVNRLDPNGINQYPTHVYADGSSDLQIFVYVTQRKITKSESGEGDKDETIEGWVKVKDIAGSSDFGGSYDGDIITADDRGNMTGDKRVIYNINKVYFESYNPDDEIKNHEYTLTMGSTSQDYITYGVWQEANIRETVNNGDPTYTFNINNTNFRLESAIAQSYTINFDSYTTQKKKYKYTSNYVGPDGNKAPDEIEYQYCYASLSGTSNNYASIVDDTDKYSFTINIYANPSIADRNINVIITDGDGYTHTVTLVQPGDIVTQKISIEFDHLELIYADGSQFSGYASAAGENVYINVVLKRTVTTSSQVGGNGGSNSGYVDASYVKVLDGSADGASIKGNTGSSRVYISFPNLGKTEYEYNNSYTIREIQWWYYEGNQQFDDTYSLWLYDEPITVYQEWNEKEKYGSATFSLSVVWDESSSNVINVNAAPQYLPFTISKSTVTQKYIYTADPDNPITETSNCKCTVSTNNGEFMNGSNTISLSAGSEDALSIDGNSSATNTKSTTVTFDNGTTKTYTIKQGVDQYVKTIYEEPSITSNATLIYTQEVDQTSSDSIPAAGGECILNAAYSQKSFEQWLSTVKKNEKYNNSYAQCTIVSGTASSAVDKDGAKAQLTNSNTGIKMGNAGNNTYTSDRLVYTVNSYKITVNGQTSKTKTHTLKIYQQANQEIGSTYDSYAINLTYNNSGNTFSDADAFTINNNGLNHNGGYHRVKVASCTRKKYNTYTSGYKDPTGTQENTTATISVSLNNSIGYYLKANSSASSVQTLDVNAGSEFLFIPGGNTTSSNRVFTMYGKCKNNTSTQDTIKFTQSPASYAITVDPTDVGFGYGGGSTKVTVEPLINGSAVTALPTVSSKPSWVNVDMTSWIDDSYALISVGSNGGGTSSTSSRSGSVVFKHPQSSNTATLSVAQNGYTYTPPSGGDSVTSVEIEAWEESYGTIGYQLYFDGTIMDPITIKVQDSNAEWSNVLAEKSEDGIPFTDSLVGSIYVSNPTHPMYVHAYLNGKNIGYGIVQ